MEEMMTNEVMEQVAENTVDSVVSSGKGSSKLGTCLKIVGTGVATKKLIDLGKALVCKISPKFKTNQINKQIKKLEKEGFTVTKVQPELNASDFDVNDKDFE